MKTGTVKQIIGAAVDIEFSQDQLPAIENAIEIEMDGGQKIVAEVAQQMGDGIVRCVALESTDGLQRGAEARDLGGPLQVPVGEGCLGRLMDVLGKPQDHRGDIKSSKMMPIHRKAPSLQDQNPTPELFETGIKVSSPTLIGVPVIISASTIVCLNPFLPPTFCTYSSLYGIKEANFNISSLNLSNKSVPFLLTTPTLIPSISFGTGLIPSFSRRLLKALSDKIVGVNLSS